MALVQSHPIIKFVSNKFSAMLLQPYTMVAYRSSSCSRLRYSLLYGKLVEQAKNSVCVCFIITPPPPPPPQVLSTFLNIPYSIAPPLHVCLASFIRTAFDSVCKLLETYDTFNFVVVMHLKKEYPCLIGNT